MTAFDIPTFTTVIISAAIDSINPCAIGVLILLISTLLAIRAKPRKMITIGSLYIAAIFIVYFSAGLGLTAFLSTIPLSIATYITMVVSLLVVAGGLVEIKDYFWYGQGFSLAIPASKVKTIEKLSKNTTSFGIVLLGAFVAAVELPCTGGPYLAITTLLSQNFDLTAVYLLIIYNIIFVMPLLVILVSVFFGAKIYDVKRWKMRNRALMRLAAGILLVMLGILLMFIANGTINLM